MEKVKKKYLKNHNLKIPKLLIKIKKIILNFCDDNSNKNNK